MIDHRRLALAAADPNVVVDADGLIGGFNDAGVLDPLDALAAMTIARLHGEQNPTCILAAALTVRGSRLGHVCIRLHTLPESVVLDEGQDGAAPALPWPGADDWIPAITSSPLVGAPGEATPLILVDDRLYLHRYHAYEDEVARFVETRIVQPGATLDVAVVERLHTLFADEGDSDASKQLLAARKALSGAFTVVAGGPGTGKTRTAAAMLVALALETEIFPHVALVAPTGKAAARLGEAIEEESARLDNPRASDRLAAVETSTIHRLLGYHPERGRFLHDRRHRLAHDLVIVDEMSMVSLPLAAKLFDALRDDTSVVLVGDPGQLESIEAGTVLADIVGPGISSSTDQPSGAPIADRVVVLDRVYRFDEKGGIGDFAAAVRTGDADAAITMLERRSDDLQWIDGSTGSAKPVIDRIVEHRIALVEQSKSGAAQEALDLLDELAVLSAHRRGPGSVEEWRWTIEAAVDAAYPRMRQQGEWYPGQPIMVTANDYTLDLYNGDMGVVVETDQGLRVAFDKRGVRLVDRSRIQDHTTVHAMTIHKSQGSGFQEVVVVLPSESSRLLTKELLYTAVTRASKKVVLFGDEATIRYAIGRSVERASGLGERLWGSVAR